MSTLAPGSSSLSRCPCQPVPPPPCVRRGQKLGQPKRRSWVGLAVGREVQGRGWHSHNQVAGRLLHGVLVTSCLIIFTTAVMVPEKGACPEIRWHSRHCLGTGTGAPGHYCSRSGTSSWPTCISYLLIYIRNGIESGLQSLQEGIGLLATEGHRDCKHTFITPRSVMKREVTTIPMLEATIHWRCYCPQGPGQASYSFSAGCRLVLMQQGAHGGSSASALSTCPLISFTTLCILDNCNL